MTTPILRPARALLMLAILAAPITLAACDNGDRNATVGQRLDNAGTRVRDTVDPPRGPAEDLGRKVDRATQ